MKSNLSIFILLLCFGINQISKKPSPNPKSWGFALMFTSKNFMVLALILRFLFLSILKLYFSHVYIQLFQHHLLKRLSLFYRIAFALLSKISRLYLCGSISRLSILFHWPVHSLASTTLSWLLWLYNEVWSLVVSVF